MSTVQEVGNAIVALVKESKYEEAISTYYSPDIVSTEPTGENPVSKGIDAIKAKTEWWVTSMEVHKVDVYGPWFNGNQFTATYNMDVTDKKSGNRFTLFEVALYTVEDGKIVDEKFFYNMG